MQLDTSKSKRLKHFSPETCPLSRGLMDRMIDERGMHVLRGTSDPAMGMWLDMKENARTL